MNENGNRSATVFSGDNGSGVIQNWASVLGKIDKQVSYNEGPDNGGGRVR